MKNETDASGLWVQVLALENSHDSITDDLAALKELLQEVIDTIERDNYTIGGGVHKLTLGYKWSAAAKAALRQEPADNPDWIAKARNAWTQMNQADREELLNQIGATCESESVWRIDLSEVRQEPTE